MGGKAAAGLALLALLAAGCGGAGRPRFRSADGWRLMSGQNELAAVGIVIWAVISRQGTQPPSTPLPLRLSEALPSNPFEGFGCAPAVPVSRCDAASGSVRRLVAEASGYYVDLYVFFGTDHPAAASVGAANAEFARLRLPVSGLPLQDRSAPPARAGMPTTRRSALPRARRDPS
jgi:hypothetical protein